ncbi:MAG: helix-turn-helix transcriptional regulator [Paenibacillaceae bacterium]|nr:helix-turn-helix transcriptional regulator [Paenibacillaceae bacterium]
MLELVSVYFDDMTPDWRKEEAATLTDMLILMVSGKVAYRLNGETIVLEKGDLLYIPQGVMRAGRDTPEGPHQKYSMHFRLRQAEAFPLEEPYPYRKVRTRKLDYMKQRFAALSHHWIASKPHDLLIGSGMATEMLGCFLQEATEDGFASVKLRLMKEVQQYIVAHYREPVRIQELAELVDRAPNYVTQTFKEVTGMTPITYLHQIRVHAARDLILNTRMTIGEVADYLGYSDQAHFNRTFKKTVGFPPSAVQRELERKRG